MARRTKTQEVETRRQPARTSESREQQLSSLAYDLAEEQIRGGTASSQVITHFLKMGSTREQLEQQRMQHEIELMEVKKQSIENQARIEDLFTAAIDAMRSYTGSATTPHELEAGDDDAD